MGGTARALRAGKAVPHCGGRRVIRIETETLLIAAPSIADMLMAALEELRHLGPSLDEGYINMVLIHGTGCFYGWASIYRLFLYLDSPAAYCI